LFFLTITYFALAALARAVVEPLSRAITSRAFGAADLTRLIN